MKNEGNYLLKCIHLLAAMAQNNASTHTKDYIVSWSFPRSPQWSDTLLYIATRVGALFSKSEVRLIQEKSSKSAQELVLNGDADFPLHILVSSCWMSLLRSSKIFFLIFLSLMHFCAIYFLFNRPTLCPRLFRDLKRHLTFGRKFFLHSTI